MSRYRPLLELLENRLAPAVVSWDAGGDALTWSDPLNWDTNTVPGAADDVVIDRAPVVELYSTAAIQTLQGSSMLYVYGSLSLSASSTFAGWLNINGNLDLQPGVSFGLTGGGAVYGTVNVDASSAVNITSLPFDVWAGGAMSGSGWYNLSATTFYYHSDLSVAKLSLDNAGLIDGSGKLTITDTFDWRGGDLVGFGSTTEVAAGGTMNISSASERQLTDRSIDNNGTVNWSDGDITANSATIYNKAGGLFDIQGDVTLDDFEQDSTLTNDRTLRKSARACTARIESPVTNDSWFDIQMGTVDVAGPFAQNPEEPPGNGTCTRSIQRLSALHMR